MTHTERVEALLRLYFLLERGMASLLSWAARQDEIDQPFAEALRTRLKDLEKDDRNLTLGDERERNWAQLTVGDLLRYAATKSPSAILGNRKLATAGVRTLRDLMVGRNKLMHGEIRDHPAYDPPQVIHELNATFELLRAELVRHAGRKMELAHQGWKRIFWLTRGELERIASAGRLRNSEDEVFPLPAAGSTEVKVRLLDWRIGLPKEIKPKGRLWISEQPLAEDLARPYVEKLPRHLKTTHRGGASPRVALSAFGPSDWEAEPFGIPIWDIAPDGETHICVWDSSA